MSIGDKIKTDLIINCFPCDDYLSFENIDNDTVLNSTFKKESHYSPDYNGGFIKCSNNYKKQKNGLLISKTPSLSSKGFDNTFKLLENQIEATRSKTTKLMQSLCCQNLNRGIVGKRKHVDLELHTLQRILTLLSSYCFDVIDKESLTWEHVFNSLSNLKCITLISRELLDNISLLQIKVDAKKDYSNNILYCASKANGTNRLKIVRCLLLNKVLCGNRVSQMTRTYEDIEAVTRLLEEKEKDLELTIQIGKELLTQNNILENKIIHLEGDLRACNDDRAQLLHELHKKNELIAVLTNDSDDGNESETTPTFSKSITMDVLQKKISSLQNENDTLKNEVLQLACQTDEVEEQERKLMTDITSQLHIVNNQYDNLNLELERQREENRLQYEQIVSLTARLKEAEMRLHQITNDNEEHVSLLNITKENQNCLAFELVEFKQRYQEVLSLLQETQEQLRKHRKKVMPSGHNATKGLLQTESLHSELMESSIYSENSLDSGIYGGCHRNNEFIKRQNVNPICNVGFDVPTGNINSSCKQVFDTVRCASKNGIFTQTGNMSKSQLVTTSMTSSSIPRMSSMAYLRPASASDTSIEPCNYYKSNYGSTTLFERSVSFESLSSQSNYDYPSHPTGVPGAPGAKDLEAALKRLTPAEILARRAMLSYAPIGTYTYEDNTMIEPIGTRTPDSILSTGSSGMSSSTNMFSSINQWRLPEKLQIVKPLEGSQTLNHWSRLATPTLSGLLEERPGVTIRGGRGLEALGIQMYTLSDVEEDVTENLPGKQFETSGCIYTYITSTVMHPDDGIVNDTSFLSQSQVSSRVASASTSRQPSCPPTPKTGLSRRNSCTTFSVNIGLATLLNERGIKAVTPSALNTPVGQNFSPTVTPCNSPEGSPTRSLSPEPLFSTLFSGADLIRRKIVGDMNQANRNKQQQIILSRLEKRALRSLKLVEKVESIGLANIISTQPSAMYHAVAIGISNRNDKPLEVSNINSNSRDMEDHILFNREDIKDVLNRGLITYKSDSRKNKDDGLITITKDCTNKFHQQANQSISRGKQICRIKSRRNIKNGISTQRPDLGTINHVRSDLGKVIPGQNSQKLQLNYENIKIQNENRKSDCCEPQSITQSFVGSVSSLLFGRKGGWL